MEKNAAPTRNITMLDPAHRARAEEAERHERRVGHLELDEGEDDQQDGGDSPGSTGCTPSPTAWVSVPTMAKISAPRPAVTVMAPPMSSLGEFSSASLPLGLGQVHQGRHGGGDADGDVDEEDPAPGELGREDAAEDDAGRTAGAGDGTPDADGLGQPDAGEGGDDDGEGGRRQEGAADALHGPGRGEPGRVLGQAADQAGHGEQPQPEQVDPAAPEQVGGPAAEQQEAGEGEHVGVDHPLQPGGAVVQVPPDGGKGHVDDGHIEHDHELGHAGNGQDHPIGDPPSVGGAPGTVVAAGSASGHVSHSGKSASLVVGCTLPPRRYRFWCNPSDPRSLPDGSHAPLLCWQGRVTQGGER